jgi:hypothetical protein
MWIKTGENKCPKCGGKMKKGWLGGVFGTPRWVSKRPQKADTQPGRAHWLYMKPLIYGKSCVDCGYLELYSEVDVEVPQGAANGDEETAEG